MRLTDAIKAILDRSGERDEACRIVEGHLRHLRKKEEGTNDGYIIPEGEVHTYVEYHYLPGIDFGLAYNEDSVWVCMDSVGLFRARAQGDKIFSEYHPISKEYKWQATLKGTSHEQQVEYSKRLEEEHAKVKAERDDLKRQLEELKK